MKQEIFEKLIPFEDILHRAYYEGYYRALASEHQKQLSAIYNDAFGGGSKIMYGCGTCVLKDLKRLGEEYFRFKSELEIKEQEVIEFSTGGTTINQETIVEEPKKKGRPRKEK